MAKGRSCSLLEHVFSSPAESYPPCSKEITFTTKRPGRLGANQHLELSFPKPPLIEKEWEIRLALLLLTGFSESAEVCASAAAVIINNTHLQTTFDLVPGKQLNRSGCLLPGEEAEGGRALRDAGAELW